MTEKEVSSQVSRPKPVSPERKEYQNLVYKTLRHLLTCLYQEGFCQEPGENERHYWVALKRNSQQQYAILATATYEKGLLKQADIGAGDWNVPLEGKRILLFGLSKWDPTISFSDPLWEGAALFSIERTVKGRNERLSRKERKIFLNELLNAEIDQEETRKEFERSKKESPNWRHYWAKERPLLALP